MNKERTCIFRKIENVQNQKLFLRNVQKLEGVSSAKITDGVLECEIYEFADEKSVLGELNSLANDVSATLVELDEPIEQVDADVESYLKEEAEKEKTPSITEREKSLKKSVLGRTIEIVASIVLFCIAAFLIEANPDRPFDFKMIIYVCAFTLVAYDILYNAFIAITKKQAFDVNIFVSIALLFSVFTMNIAEACLISTGFAILYLAISSAKQLRMLKIEKHMFGLESDGNHKIEIEVYENGLDEMFGSNKNFGKVLSIIGYVLSACVLLFLIPALKTDFYFGVYSVLLLIVIVAKSGIMTEYKKNAYVVALINGIDFGDDKNLDKFVKANALEISASVLSDDGELKTNTLGAMKEMLTLGIKSLKTNFDVELKQEVSEQIDFVDKDFNGKRLETVGKTNCDVNFECEKCQGIAINSSEIRMLPKAFRMAKALKKKKSIIICCFAVLVALFASAIVFAVLKNALASLIIVAVSAAISALFGVINGTAVLEKTDLRKE